MITPAWLWIPLTIFAAAAQTVRNTAQRRLTGELGTLGATLVRFLYGMPLLTLWLLGLLALQVAIRGIDFSIYTDYGIGYSLLKSLRPCIGCRVNLRGIVHCLRGGSCGYPLAVYQHCHRYHYGQQQHQV